MATGTLPTPVDTDDDLVIAITATSPVATLLAEARGINPLMTGRELTVNGMEAVLAVGGGKVLLVPALVDGVLKLRIVDTGCGVSGDTWKLFGDLHHTSKELGDNKGIGFKLAALALHPYGVHIVTLCEGDATATEVTLRLDDLDVANGGPGARPRRVPIHKSGLHPAIKKAGHGTQITLLGKSADDVTWDHPSPDKKGGSKRWAAQELNRRLFTIPAGVTVQLQETTGYGKQKGRLTGRTIVGAKAVLDSAAVPYGHRTKRVTGAKIHWWVLEADKKGTNTQYKDAANAVGFIGVLYRNEIHQSVSGVAAKDMFRRFGVLRPEGRVVLLIEPDDNGNLHADNKRENVLMDRPDGSATPVDPTEFCDEFRTDVPDPIERLNQAELRRSVADEKAVKALDTNRGWFAVSMFRRSRGSAIVAPARTSDTQLADATEPVERHTGEPRPRTEGQDRAEQRRRSGRGNPEGSTKVKRSTTGRRASRTGAGTVAAADVVWCTNEHRLRDTLTNIGVSTNDVADYLTDVAADFDPVTNVIEVNTDHPDIRRGISLVFNEVEDRRSTAANSVVWKAYTAAVAPLLVQVAAAARARISAGVLTVEQTEDVISHRLSATLDVPSAYMPDVRAALRRSQMLAA